MTCVIRNSPVGLGEPVFDKLEAVLAHAMLSIPATKGFEIGSGFAGTELAGSKHNDAFVKKSDGTLGTKTNRSGGIQGGISNGEDIYFKCVVLSSLFGTFLADEHSFAQGCVQVAGDHRASARDFKIRRREGCPGGPGAPRPLCSAKVRPSQRTSLVLRAHLFHPGPSRLSRPWPLSSLWSKSLHIFLASLS